MADGRLVLVVEDDESIRQFLELALRDEGFAVISAANGSLALAMLADARPDVILLDVRMPVMDGAAFAEAYKRTSPSHAPIIVLTAAHELEIQHVQPFADAVLRKPFHIDDLLQMIAAQLGNE